ncbi:MAG: aminotransferase class V-fold PLP-dependent enzyme [Alphaproteobacteria bacterium]|nr:aminotransferase class V-fold PLP-dependent enzyme [Alphaproteobacteria bacterium]
MTTSDTTQSVATDTPTAVYLDYQATTPVDPRVVDAMLPWFSEHFGNAHSTQHAFGAQAAEAVEAARAKVAALLGADPREIIFTSGATESNNLAIKGAARFARRHGRDGHAGDHIVVLETEHKCVLESAFSLAEEGIRTTVLNVGADGLVDLGALAEAIEEGTVLVSIMAVNNEIGVIQPMAEIGRLCRSRGVLFHTDAAQAAGKIPLDVDDMSIDLLSVSGHKMYAPKGVGVLYVRRRPRARLLAEISGGGQERGVRSGTLAVPLIVAVGVACEIADQEMNSEALRLVEFRQSLLAQLQAAVPDLVVNGGMEHRIAGNLNIAFPGIDVMALMLSLGDVAVSTGSACTSESVEPSYVLQALGLPRSISAGSIRIGFGRFTTQSEIDYAARRIGEEVAAQRGGHEAAAQ